MRVSAEFGGTFQQLETGAPRGTAVSA